MSRGSVVVMADGRKLGLISPHLMPSVAICDPDLTLGLPPSLTAATGLDAMSHCMETCKCRGPLSSSSDVLTTRCWLDRPLSRHQPAR